MTKLGAFLIAIVLALVALTAVSAGVPRTAHAATAVTLSANPLGVNVPPWDFADANSTAKAKIQSALQALGPTAFRYGGGSWADAYDWQTNVDTYSKCAGQHVQENTDNYSPGSPCYSTSSDALSYGNYINLAKSENAAGMVTVNYGSGPTSMAAAWATQAKNNGDPVNGFEIGNENYGCGEINIPITQPPVNYTQWEPNVPADCPYTTYGSNPGMQKIADSYNAHAPAFISAIKQANPNAKIVIPYALDNGGASGSADVWDHGLSGQQGVLQGLSGQYDMLDVHYYATNASSVDPATAMADLKKIPSWSTEVTNDIANYAPAGTQYTVGEANLSNHITTTPCTPTGAVFSAGAALNWLAAGAQSMDWWVGADGNNSGGNCVNPDYSMFDVNGNAQYPYYGYLIASKILKPGAQFSSDTADSTANVQAFSATEPDGSHAEAYVNLDTTASETVTSPTLTGPVTSYQFSNANPTVTQGSTTVGSSVTLPAESVTVFTQPSGPLASSVHTTQNSPVLYVDDPSGSTAAGTILQGTSGVTDVAGEQWVTQPVSGTSYVTEHLKSNQNYCMDVRNYGITNGTQVQIWPCNGGADQQWQETSSGQLEAVYATQQSGNTMVLDDPFGQSGQSLQIWQANGNDQQYWDIP